MPRHTFSIPPDMRIAVQRHITVAVAGINLERYYQEATYVAVLAYAIEGIAYDGPNGKVSFVSTVFNDRGPNSAESFLGADLAITAEIEQGNQQVRKAILVQAKLGEIVDLRAAEVDRLRGQIERMQMHTRSPKIMEIPSTDGIREPYILSGRRFAEGQSPRSVPLPGYITSRVLTTLDGDTRPDFVDAIQDSRALRLHILTHIGERIS